jgi:putative membrane protein
MAAPTHLTPGPDLRDLLAAERTFLAWIRTGLALMGFGFVVARFGLFLQQLQLVQHAPAAPTQGLSLWFGTALIAVGVAVFVLSAWHHVRLVQELNRGGPVPSRPSTQAVAIALFLALVGLAMAIYLISLRAPANSSCLDPKMNEEPAMSMAIDPAITDPTSPAFPLASR